MLGSSRARSSGGPLRFTISTCNCQSTPAWTSSRKGAADDSASADAGRHRNTGASHPAASTCSRRTCAARTRGNQTSKAPQAFGIFEKGRLVLFYSYESDLGNGWEDADKHGDPPELREAALRMGVNLFMYALAQVVS